MGCEVALLLKTVREAKGHGRCPRCGGRRRHRWGTFSGRQRFRCLGCRRTFSDLTGTPMAYTKRTDRWIAFATRMVRKTSVRACAQQLGIHKDTAWRWRHRLLFGVREGEDDRLAGVVELEAVRFTYSEKGRRRLQRRPFRTGSRTPLLSREQPWVLLALDGAGTVTADPIGFRRHVHGAELAEILARRCARVSAILASPLWTIPLTPYCRARGARHILTGAAAARGCEAPSIARLMAYDRRFRCWVESFRGVASRYLANYLCWHRFMDPGGARPLDLLRRSLRPPHSSCRQSVSRIGHRAWGASPARIGRASTPVLDVGEPTRAATVPSVARPVPPCELSDRPVASPRARSPRPIR